MINALPSLLIALIDKVPAFVKIILVITKPTCYRLIRPMSCENVINRQYSRYICGNRTKSDSVNSLSPASGRLLSSRPFTWLPL